MSLSERADNRATVHILNFEQEDEEEDKLKIVTKDKKIRKKGKDRGNKEARVHK